MRNIEQGILLSEQIGDIQDLYLDKISDMRLQLMHDIHERRIGVSQFEEVHSSMNMLERGLNEAFAQANTTQGHPLDRVTILLPETLKGESFSELVRLLGGEELLTNSWQGELRDNPHNDLVTYDRSETAKVYGTVFDKLYLVCREVVSTAVEIEPGVFKGFTQPTESYIRLVGEQLAFVLFQR